MTREARQLRCPDDVLSWIPWYVDGTLTDRQMGCVESHAAECAECRAEIDMISGAPFEIDVDLPDPDRVFSEIQARIAGEAGVEFEDVRSDAYTPAASYPPAGEDEFQSAASAEASLDADRIASWLGDKTDDWDSEQSDTPASQSRGVVVQGPWMRSNALAAAAAIVLLSVGALFGASVPGWTGGEIEDAAYQTATAQTAAAGSAEDLGPQIDVVFRESASVNEISESLRQAGAEIVSGPTKLGVYRVQLSTDGGAVDAAAAAARFKSSPEAIAVFAEVVR